MKGKKTDTARIYEIMTAWAVCGSYSETARTVGAAETSVRKIVTENKDKPEYVKLCAEKRKSLSERADVILDKIIQRANDLLDSGEKIPLNQLSTAYGIFYDKKQLADGKPTSSVQIIGDGVKIDKLAEMAGYERKQHGGD